MAQPDNFLESKFNDFMNRTKYNTDDFVWILFEKPCGYSFIYPFPKNASINILYQHLDSLWTDTINHIWTTEGIIISRNNLIRIRTWINESNNQPISFSPFVYRVFFDTYSTPNINLNNHHNCCNNKTIN